MDATIVSYFIQARMMTTAPATTAVATKTVKTEATTFPEIKTQKTNCVQRIKSKYSLCVVFVKVCLSCSFSVILKILYLYKNIG